MFSLAQKIQTFFLLVPNNFLQGVNNLWGVQYLFFLFNFFLAIKIKIKGITKKLGGLNKQKNIGGRGGGDTKNAKCIKNKTKKNGADRQTDKHPDRYPGGSANYMTESAQWTN